jgi:hypothetical protein
MKENITSINKKLVEKVKIKEKQTRRDKEVTRNIYEFEHGATILGINGNPK